MANRMSAGPGAVRGVVFDPADPSFGIMPRNVVDILRSLHSVDYSQSEAGGVTTGTLEVPGLGQVAAIEVTDRPANGLHGIDTLRFLDAQHRALVTISNVDQAERYPTTAAALSAFLLTYGNSVEALYETANAISGSAATDRVHGGDGADAISGGAGRDVLFGDAGNDRVVGGAGNDRIDGGAGTDLLVGQAGADLFTFRAVVDSRPGALADTIDDFDARADRIDLRPLDADPMTAGDQAMHYIGGAAFGHHAGEVRFAGHALQGDVNGDGVADFEVHFGTHSVLTGFGASDILL